MYSWQLFAFLLEQMSLVPPGRSAVNHLPVLNPPRGKNHHAGSVLFRNVVTAFLSWLNVTESPELWQNRFTEHNCENGVKD